jgi:aspartate aminotransferase
MIVNGMSKGFAMTGWRIGYMAGPKEMVQACDKFQSQFTSGTNSIAQKASVAAMMSDLKTTVAMRESFRERKDFVVKAMEQMPGVKINHPKGAFYVFPDISSFFGKNDGDTHINSDEDLCMYLLHKANVSTVMGEAFGNNNCIRISFANSMENLQEAMRRIGEALARLK